MKSTSCVVSVLFVKTLMSEALAVTPSAILLISAVVAVAAAMLSIADADELIAANLMKSAFVRPGAFNKISVVST